jgi:hypothetical protein
MDRAFARRCDLDHHVECALDAQRRSSAMRGVIGHAPAICVSSAEQRDAAIAYRCMLRFIQIEVEMPKAVASRRRSEHHAGSRRRASREGRVRKNVVMDQRKLDAARRILGVATETEAIDLALDFVAFRREVAQGIAAMRRVGGIDDVLESRRRA